MKHVIRAIILIIILFFVAEHYQYAPNLMGIISVLFIISFMYLIAAIIGAFRKRMITRRQTAHDVTTTANNNSGCSGLLLIILLLALTYVFKDPLSIQGSRAFHFVDHLLQLRRGISPVIFWAILGLLVGSIYGSLVAWKKYKLNAPVNLIPIGVLIVFIAILYVVNKPAPTSLDTVSNMQTTYAYSLVMAEVYNAPPDDNKQRYKPAFLLDSSDNTAWMTDISNGIAELRFSFKGQANYANKEVQCVGFMIKNGYRKSPQLWNNFARAKSLSIKYNGRFITNAIVKDNSNGTEEIKINPIPISSFDHFSISINAVYPGEKYPTRVAVSELVPIVEYEKGL